MPDAPHSPPRASILLAVYNAVDVLRLTLRGLARQSETDFEIVLCDDGSGPEMDALVRDITQHQRHAVVHVRQSDDGFRKCRALNLGVRAAHAPVLIFLDPDCLPHRRFVEAHLREQRPGTMLAGRRVQLGPDLTAALQRHPTSLYHRLESPRKIAWWGVTGRVRHATAGIYLPPRLRSRVPDRPLALKGCNFSCARHDLERLNGFDSSFNMPGGGEDTDLERRLLAAGLTTRSVKHAALCYHLYHPVRPRTGAHELCQRRAAEGHMESPDGLRELPVCPD